MSDADLQIRRQTALSELNTANDVSFTEGLGDFQREFVSVCGLFVRAFGETFVDPDGSWQEKKADALDQCAVVLTLTPPQDEAFMRRQLFEYSKLIYEWYATGTAIDYQYPMDWITQQYLMTTIIASPTGLYYCHAMFYGATEDGKTVRKIYGTINDVVYSNRALVTFDGSTGYLAAAHLGGTETVVSSDGTSTPTISAGRIDFTAGTCANLLLSDGTFYPMEEDIGAIHYDTSGGGNDATASGGVTWTTANAIRSWNIDGFSLYEHASLGPLYVAYSGDIPLVITPPTGYTKTSDNKGGFLHNGANIDMTWPASVGNLSGLTKTHAQILATAASPTDSDNWQFSYDGNDNIVDTGYWATPLTGGNLTALYSFLNGRH